MESELFRKGDYTLGKVNELEDESSSWITGTNSAVGVGSGTDAIFKPQGYWD